MWVFHEETLTTAKLNTEEVERAIQVANGRLQKNSDEQERAEESEPWRA